MREYCRLSSAHSPSLLAMSTERFFSETEAPTCRIASLVSRTSPSSCRSNSSRSRLGTVAGSTSTGWRSSMGAGSSGATAPPSREARARFSVS